MGTCITVGTVDEEIFIIKFFSPVAQVVKLTCKRTKIFNGEQLAYARMYTSVNTVLKLHLT